MIQSRKLHEQQQDITRYNPTKQETISISTARHNTRQCKYNKRQHKYNTTQHETTRDNASKTRHYTSIAQQNIYYGLSLSSLIISGSKVLLCFKRATKSYFMHYLCVATIYISLHFLPTLSKNKFFVFPCSVFFVCFAYKFYFIKSSSI